MCDVVKSSSGIRDGDGQIERGGKWAIVRPSVQRPHRRKDPYWTQGVEFNLRHFSTIWSCGKLQCAIHTFSSSPSLGSAVIVGDLKGEQGEGRPEPRLFILIKSVHVIRLLNSLTYYEFRLKHYRVRHHEHSGECKLVTRWGASTATPRHKATHICKTKYAR